MMRRFNRLPAALLLGGLAFAASAPAARAEVGRFLGGGVVYNFNQACRNAGWIRPNEPFSDRYHPRNIGTNGNQESISFHSPVNSLSFVRNNGAFTSSFTPVDHGGSFRRPYFIPDDAPNAAQIRIGRRDPASLTASFDGSVRLVGRIRNWSGVSGCVAFFDVVVGAIEVQ
jgi:hypothetical protein